MIQGGKTCGEEESDLDQVPHETDDILSMIPVKGAAL